MCVAFPGFGISWMVTDNWAYGGVMVFMHGWVLFLVSLIVLRWVYICIYTKEGIPLCIILGRRRSRWSWGSSLKYEG